MDDTANGHSESSTQGAEGARQAEELLSHWGRRAGQALSLAAARLREEAEDMLAEAQSIRRGDRD